MLFVHTSSTLLVHDGGNIVAVVVVFLIMKGQLCGILYDPQLINNPPNVGNRFFLVGSTWSAFGTSLDKSEWSKEFLKSAIFLGVALIYLN